jgi:hypothetical protein
MRQDEIVMLCMGLALSALGWGMSVNEKLARWGLSRGPSRIWVLVLGEPRAVKLTRYFFGPVVGLVGLVCLAMLLLPTRA